MPVYSSNLTLSASTPQQLGSSNQRRQQLIVYVNSGVMYVGDSAVTSSDGLPYAAGGDPFEVHADYEGDLTPGEAFYAVGSAAIVVRIIEIVSG